jgi:hypothetical protein
MSMKKVQRILAFLLFKMPMIINLYSQLECIPSKMCILSSILLFLALPICYAEARTPLELPIQDSIRSEQDECNAVRNKPLQAVRHKFLLFSLKTIDLRLWIASVSYVTICILIKLLI